MNDATPFTGSYRRDEVEFLLRPLSLEATPLVERERLIQSGQRHYSEMIGPEDAPTRERLALFRECLENNGDRFATDLAGLADALAASAYQTGELTLVSIARAGTPVGVLLWHRLHRVAPGLRLAHYSISVIRDRGVDRAAMRHILDRHAAASLRFIDGWTGKGTIARELRTSIDAWSSAPPDLDPGLWTPLDVCGVAAMAASDRDYLIPPSLLGGTISGLVSRSVLPRSDENGSAFHGCVRLTQLRRYDLSRWFIDVMNDRLSRIPPRPSAGAVDRFPRRAETQSCLDEMLVRHQLMDPNRIKLGIGETVRVLLRRLPKVVILSDSIPKGDADIISRLAALRRVPVETESGLPFDAVAVIGSAMDPTKTQSI
jgi:hypothetical protein